MGQVCAGQGGVHFVTEEIDSASPDRVFSLRDPKAAAALCGGTCVVGSAQPAEDVIVSQKCVIEPGPRRPADAEPLLARSRLLVPHRQLRFGDYYEVGRKLGEGSFGNVYEGLVLRVDPATGQPVPSTPTEGQDQPQPAGARRVAIKIFQMSEDGGGGATTPRGRQQDARKCQSFEAERQMLAQLEHPNIVRMYECFQERSKLYIVLEICRGGELYGRLVSKMKEAGGGGGLEEPLSRSLFRQMLHAVGYLHGKRIVHRDIKTENFLLVDEDGSPEAEVLKLCDFGTSCRLTDAKPRSMENIGTLSYTAPEIYEQRGADIAADCWSLGVVLYVILTGTNPFRLPGKDNKEDVIKRIKAADFEIRRRSWLKVSSPGQDVVRRLLVLDERERLTCAQALRSRWVVGSERHAGKQPAVNQEAVLSEHAPRVVALLLRLPSLAAAQRLTLTACAVAATEGDLDKNVPWREMFKALDADQDGRLSYAEMVEGLTRMLGIARSRGGQHAIDFVEDTQAGRLASAVQALDIDQSGSIDWVEWLALALLGSMGTAQAREPVSTAFRLLDRPLRACDLIDSIPEGVDAAGATVGEVIRAWEPPAEHRDNLPMTEPPPLVFTLSHLRLVLASLEIYKML